MVLHAAACLMKFKGLGLQHRVKQGCSTCAQVLDDELCYKYSEYGTVYEVFATRARMFRSVYLHKCAPVPCCTSVEAHAAVQ